MPPKYIAELILRDTVHVDLIGQYNNSLRQYKTGGAIIRNNDSLTCMMIIDSSTGWFEIIDIMTFDLDEVTAGNDE